MSQVVQVNDAEGKNLTKVLVGDTRTKALERLGSGRGRLENKDGIGLLNDEVITAEGGPYVFKEMQQQHQHQQDDRARLIADGEFYATSEDLWDWKPECWSETLNQLRREKSPEVYTDLVHGIEALGAPRGTGDTLLDQTSVFSDVEVLSKAKYSIFAGMALQKAHQIPKSKTCRPFYGLVAEIATGLDLRGDDNRQNKWSSLLWGGESADGHGFTGLEKRAENFVIVNNPHWEIYDTLQIGVLAIIPICDAEFSRGWEQGREYNLLVVADTAATYARLGLNTGTIARQLHRPATREEIEKATDFLGICTKALSEIVASESDMLVGPMTEVLEERGDEGLTSEKISDRTHMRAKLCEFEKLRHSLRKKNTVAVPNMKEVSVAKEVLTIDMKEYMQISGFNLYPDPWLVGMKAAINIYFGHENVKLLPACQPTPHDKDSDDSDDEGCWYLDAVHGASPYVTGAAQSSSILDVSLPKDLSIVSDDDGDTSVITDDGEYGALSNTGEQSFTCMGPNQKHRSHDVTP